MSQDQQNSEGFIETRWSTHASNKYTHLRTARATSGLVVAVEEGVELLEAVLANSVVEDVFELVVGLAVFV